MANDLTNYWTRRMAEHGLAIDGTPLPTQTTQTPQPATPQASPAPTSNNPLDNYWTRRMAEQGMAIDGSPLTSNLTATPGAEANTTPSDISTIRNWYTGVNTDLTTINNYASSGQYDADLNQEYLDKLRNYNTELDGYIESASSQGYNKDANTMQNTKNGVDALIKQLEESANNQTRVIDTSIQKTLGSAADYSQQISDLESQIEELERTNHRGVIRQDTDAVSGELYNVYGNVNDEALHQLREQLQNANANEAAAKRSELRERLRDNPNFEQYSFSATPLAENDTAIRALGGESTDAVSGEIVKDQSVKDLLGYATKDEEQLFNYILARQGEDAAAEYMDDLRYDLNARQASEKSQEASRYAGEHEVLASGKSVGQNLISGAGLFDTAIQNVYRDITGNNRRIDYNTWANQQSQQVQATRGTVAQELTDKYGTKRILGKDVSWGDAYQLGMSMLDSGATAALGGATGLGSATAALIGASAGTQAMQEAVKDGASDSQALMLGFAAMAAETITEKVSLENLLKAPGKNVLMNALRQAGIEASEEAASTILNELANETIMGEDSDFNKRVREYEANGMSHEEAQQQAWKQFGTQLLWDAIGGAISGGIMGGMAKSFQGDTNTQTQQNAETQATEATAEQTEQTASTPLAETVNRANQQTTEQADYEFQRGVAEEGAKGRKEEAYAIEIGQGATSESVDNYINELKNRGYSIRQEEVDDYLTYAVKKGDTFITRIYPSANDNNFYPSIMGQLRLASGDATVPPITDEEIEQMRRTYYGDDFIPKPAPQNSPLEQTSATESSNPLTETVLNATEAQQNASAPTGSGIDRKAQQFDIIQRTNPSNGGQQAWIESVDDIKTWQEALEEDLGSLEDARNENLFPDFKASDLREALDTGYITVYSSGDISDGAWVTPSAMEARDYTGSDNIQARRVPVDDIAWLDSTQGMYAPVEQNNSKTENPYFNTVENAQAQPTESVNPLANTVLWASDRSKNSSTTANSPNTDLDVSNANWDTDRTRIEKAISETVNEAISNKGVIKEKHNTKKLAKLGDKVTAMIFKATGIDVSNKYYAINGSEISHEFNQHSSDKEHDRGQGAMSAEKIAEAISAIYDPDIIEGLFRGSTSSHRKSFVIAKKSADGNYVVVEAVGGKNNPTIIPIELLEISEKKWNTYYGSGKTIGEMLYENDPQKLKELDVNKNKKSRVIAAQFTSQEVLANDPHSPRFNNSVPQSEANVNSKANTQQTEPQAWRPEGQGEDVREHSTSERIRERKTVVHDALVEETQADPSYYKVRHNKDTVAAAEAVLFNEDGSEADLNEVASHAETKLSNARNGTGKIRPEDVLISVQAADRLMEHANTLEQSGLTQEAQSERARADRIMSALYAEQAEAGQLSQAARLISKASPATQRQMRQDYLERCLNDWNSKLTKAQGRKIQAETGANTIQLPAELTEAYVNAETDADLQKAYSDIVSYVGQNTPSTLYQQITALRFLNMLGNPVTQGRNIIGNTFSFANYFVKRRMQSALESIFTPGEKTFALGVDLNDYKAWWGLTSDPEIEAMLENNGRYQDVRSQNRSKFAQDAIDEQTIFGSAPVEGYRKLTNKATSGGDIIFLKMNFADAAQAYAKAHGFTLETATPEQRAAAVAVATKEAQEATFHDDTAISELATKARVDENGEWANRNRVNKATAKIVNALGDGLQPFRKTPANVAVRGEEFSPLGFINTIIKGAVRAHDIKTKGSSNITTSDIINQLSKALTGTGLTIAGAMLRAAGKARTSDDEDKNLNDYEKMNGRQDYAIKINGKWTTADWAAPDSIPFFMGVELYDALNGNGQFNEDDIINVFGALTGTMTEMSMLQGINDTLKGLNSFGGDDNALMKFVTALGSSYLQQLLGNSFLGRIESAATPYRQSTYIDPDSGLSSETQYALGRLSNKIPFWDFQQEDYIDAWGNKVENQNTSNPLTRAVRSIGSPAYISEEKTTELDQALYDLNAELKELGIETNVFPSRAKRSVDNVQLTPKEYERFATEQGHLSHDLVEELTKSPYWDTLSAEEKANAITSLYSYAKDRAEQNIRASRGTIEVGKSDNDKLAAAFDNNAEDIAGYLALKGSFSDRESTGDYAGLDSLLATVNTAKNEDGTYSDPEVQQMATDKDFARYLSAYANGTSSELVGSVLDNIEAVNNLLPDANSADEGEKMRIVFETLSRAGADVQDYKNILDTYKTSSVSQAKVNWLVKNYFPDDVETQEELYNVFRDYKLTKGQWKTPFEKQKDATEPENLMP